MYHREISNTYRVRLAYKLIDGPARLGLVALLDFYCYFTHGETVEAAILIWHAAYRGLLADLLDIEDQGLIYIRYYQIEGADQICVGLKIVLPQNIRRLIWSSYHLLWNAVAMQCRHALCKIKPRSLKVSITR